MIRRDVQLADGRPGWLLIPQQEHARLSHAVASAWRGLLPDASASVRDEFLAALLHHDDGWAEWWDAPGVDPESGAPYAFTEMPPPDAQRIWTASIDACQAVGPLACWTVASHFIALQSKRDDDYPEWVDWLRRQQGRADAWLEEWRALSPDHTADLAKACLDALQLFDWVSLWLCCKAGADTEPLTLTEIRPSVSFRADDGSRFPTAPLTVTADPWPFHAEGPLEFRLPARLAAAEPVDVPARFASLGEEVTVAWRLAPRSVSR